ncbi:hypothetical protein GCM10011519_13710 [Marmoricola endophyticus]|uniref:KANL3/Tex30 alpha/beta hydrolase-like domain-containing protein n=1 Tax=Marmoricola endophyticus TaxID=2040280 RepID=A0A917BGG3_9ACTN|nr:alpha/beta family hydrolase [Marmoricola endophyticus]GGF41216.1 hypothetical protein GCM10011519_13710 [Marmoricola endophyticus]
MAEPGGARAREVETPYGTARVLTWPATGRSYGDLLLMHGANGKLDSADLVRLVTDLPDQGVTTRLLQQPFAVAGKRIGPRPAALDTVVDEVVADLSLEGPLVLGGRSAGARCAVRRAGPLGAVAALALAFPLHPPERPEKSRADELLGCTVPTLVVQGERDPFGGPGELPELPAGQEVVPVPGADHGFAVLKSWDGPDHLALLSTAVAEWLGRMLSRADGE